jgi:hypothetical protein
MMVLSVSILLVLRAAKQSSAASLLQATAVVETLWKKYSVPSKVIIDGKTIVEQQSPIAQLATAETAVRESYSIRSTWLGSEKSFHVRALFIGKAGYDLKDSMLIDLSADAQKATITLPKAQLLSVEQRELEILEDESGYWNRLDAAQRQQALEQLQQKARQSLLESGLLTQAQASLQSQFTEVLTEQLPRGFELKFQESP